MSKYTKESYLKLAEKLPTKLANMIIYAANILAEVEAEILYMSNEELSKGGYPFGLEKETFYFHIKFKNKYDNNGEYECYGYLHGHENPAINLIEEKIKYELSKAQRRFK